MAKKKGIVKKVVIGATLLLGIVGVTYNYVPKVKEGINDTIEKIIGVPIPSRNNNKEDLEKLEQVTNVHFDEKTRILTFDENLKATDYEIRITHKDGGFMLYADAGVVKIPPIETLIDGDIIEFEIIANGDNINTVRSDGKVYEFVLQIQEQKKYNSAKIFLEDFLKKAKNYDEDFIISILNPNALKIEGNYFIVEGTGLRGSATNINFMLKFDMTEYQKTNSTDYSNLNNYLDLLFYFDDNVTSKNTTIITEVSTDFLDMTEILEAKGAFDQYINQGYEIETLQYKNSPVSVEDNVSYVNYTGLYRAHHPTKGSITFKLESKIGIDNSKVYLSTTEFLEDALTEGFIAQSSEEIYDKVLNDHLLKTLEVESLNAKTSFKSNEMEY